jgi:hypothetical protein
VEVGRDVFPCSAVQRDDHEPLLMCQFVTNPLDREADKYISVKATALVCHRFSLISTNMKKRRKKRCLRMRVSLSTTSVYQLHVRPLQSIAYNARFISRIAKFFKTKHQLQVWENLVMTYSL